eukprot:gene15481-6732_t
MGDLAWLAPVKHKDIGGSKIKLDYADSLLIGSRPGSALSVHSKDGDDHGLSARYSHNSMHVPDTKWKPHKPPMSAVKGAWQQHGSRSASPNRFQNNSRSGSAVNGQETVLAVYNLSKSHKGHLGDAFSGQLVTRPLSSRSRHGVKIHVDEGDSVNKGLEDDIGNLQASLFKQGHSRNHAGEDYSNAEFVPLVGSKSIYGRSHSPTEIRQGKDPQITASNRELVYRPDGMNGQFMVTQNNGHGFRPGKLGRDTDQEFVIEDLERESGGQSLNKNLFELDTDDMNNAGHTKISRMTGEFGDRGSNNNFGDQDLNRRVQFADNSNNSSSTSDAGTGLPSIIVDDSETPSTRDASTSTLKRIEDPTEARKRKLRMKMRYANAFKNLFNEVHAESMRATLDLGSCYEPEDLKVAKTEEKKEVELEKKMEVLKPNLPHGLPMKNIKDLKTPKTKAPGYATVAEAGQLMMSPESIKVMRETLDEKRQQLFGDQPWLLGRLSLSKETCRFELPMDVHILSRISPMDYVTRYTVISRRRRSLYKSTFQKNDKDRDGWISYKDLVKTVKDIHVNYIDENELDELTKILELDMSAESKYNISMFSGIAAFSERLVLHMR